MATAEAAATGAEDSLRALQDALAKRGYTGIRSK